MEEKTIMSKQIKDLTGKVFNSLTVIGFAGTSNNKSKSARWLCKCECGNECIVDRGDLIKGKTKSCGCKNREKARQLIIAMNKKYNSYDLDSEEYGIGYLSDGREFWFDKEDYELIKDKYWTINNGYVKTSLPNDKGSYVSVPLHRIVMQAKKGEVVDHINHTKKNDNNDYQKDNRKSNLRIVTTQQNTMNRTVSKKNSSGYTGVYYIKDDRIKNKKWRATITVNGKYISIGSFKTKEEAIKARQEAEQKYFGEYAYKGTE